jgi:tyrosyl-tRNA synthetase
MGFVETMREREQIAQLTHEDELFEHLQESRTGYIGFDPTAPSLHVGHLVTIMALRRWQQAGHRVIALVGGGTAAIGDPTGKTDMRKMLTLEDLADNAQKIKKQLESFMNLSDPKKGVLLNNADWLFKLEYLPFLREIGPHFSVNRMLTAECFKQRMEKGLSFLEFNYMLLQGYDFLHLFRSENCTVQLGGDDQWSNILGGMELVRRLSRKQAFGVTLPLLTTTDGKKMGKTEKGAVWLDPSMTSPYEYFQYWRNVADDMVVTCYRIFTDVPVDEIAGIAKGVEAGDANAINESKEQLGFLTTEMLHGKEEAEKARETARSLFSGTAVGGNEPTMKISPADFGDGMNILDLLVKAEIFPSKGEVRRLIQQGGAGL